MHANGKSDLIFDIGLHEAQDTAYYLHRGYRVVAVDANPAMIRAAEQRFAAEIASGKLVLVTAAIGREAGEATFWVSEKSDWSSFDQAISTRLGVKATPIQVKVISAASLFQQYGIPRYLKIDIEGADEMCLDALAADRAPTYVSWEWGEATEALERRISAMERIGYSDFKLIRQADHRATFRKEPDPIYRIGRKWRHYFGPRGWKFLYGSSGPFGEETDGRWRSGRELLALWDGFYRKHISGAEFAPGDDWFDIHARRQ